jgi:hypothetical protein
MLTLRRHTLRVTAHPDDVDDGILQQQFRVLSAVYKAMMHVVNREIGAI